MKYFTSIALLMASHADKSRVASVERNLKKINPAWNNNWLFPIVAIGLSNSADDVSWVYSTGSVCVPSSQKKVVVGDKQVTMTELNNALRNNMVPEANDLVSREKTAWIEENLVSFNVALSALAGKIVDWETGVAYLADAATSTPTLTASARVLGAVAAGHEAALGVLRQETGPELTTDPVEQVKEWFELMTDEQKAAVRDHIMQVFPYPVEAEQQAK